MIPRIFHQIWINDADPILPACFRAYSDSWRALHPAWEYRLWNLENCDFDLQRPELIGRCANYAQMADVLRLEILYRYGGVYIDTDFEPLRPIDPVVDGASHVFCSEDGAHVSTGFIGACPASPLILRLLSGLPGSLGRRAANLETGPSYVTQALLGDGFEGDVRFLPSRLLYPYGWNEPQRACEAFPEALAVHRWAHSWRTPGSHGMGVRALISRMIRALRSA
ncbi:MAG TPA: glycosyltransferase [Burkholderiaceae bacterium]|nr:glycosyltransferase [Burkholderiaceae bacterium]